MSDVAKVHLFDDGTLGPSGKHGPLGVDHWGSIELPDFEYQFEQWLIDLHEDHPKVIRVEHPDGRVYDRTDDHWKMRPLAITEIKFFDRGEDEQKRTGPGGSNST